MNTIFRPGSSTKAGFCADDGAASEWSDSAAEQYTKVSVEGGGAGTVHALIREYLVHGCYTETATAFSSSSNASSNASVSTNAAPDAMDVDGHHQNNSTNTTTSNTTNNSLVVRKQLHSLVMAGRIADAIAATNAAFPEALAGATPDSVAVCFMLQTQQFIELVRASSASTDALRFAQDELGQYGYLNPKYFDTLQDIVALIAYTDPYKSPVAHYLSHQRREEVATSLNGFLLAQQNLPAETSLERLVRQATVLRDYLSEPLVKDKKAAAKAVLYPKWELGFFLDSHSST
ncbi:CTLH/CRA C-terminal to lish motif domain-containing protein [Chytriomyces sp. MP71]|nr:CTLH/CRA C-terminal to lish motif domain-containing protein [Chytriomyces sp. MP71]